MGLEEAVDIFKEGGASKPKLIVERYDYGDDYVYAGRDFTMEL